jgi:hypothetical protein
MIEITKAMIDAGHDVLQYWDSELMGDEYDRETERTIMAIYTAMEEARLGITHINIRLGASFVNAFNAFIWPLIRRCKVDGITLPLTIILQNDLFLTQSLTGLQVHSSKDGNTTAINGDLFWINLNKYDGGIHSDICSLFERSVFPSFVKGVGHISYRRIENSLVISTT